MSDFKFDPRQLEETKAAVTAALQKLKQVSADVTVSIDEQDKEMCIDDVMRMFQSLVNNIGYSFDSVSRQIQYLSDSFYNHLDGHLPPAPGPAGMASAVKALGWDDDFEVKPRTIYGAVKDGYVKVNGRNIVL